MLSKSGTQIRYNYNAFGQRIRKTYSGTTDYRCEFCYDESGRLVCETKYSDSGSVIDKIIYLYDVNSIIGMVHTLNGVESTYYFQRNLLGDVIGIYNTNGVKVGGYAYDAWGNHAVTLDTNGIATRNPIRYRGYYYDTETKLYYLNARYYNPEWRRFISPDDTAYLDPESVNGLNLYCYCGNDPVNYADPSGNSIILTLALIGLGVGIGIGLGYATYTDYQDDSSINGSVGWQTYLGSAIVGGAIGAGLGFGIGYFGPSIASFLGGSFSFALPTFGTLSMGGATALVGGATVTVTGAQILGVAVALGAGVLIFDKGSGARMGHNQHEKQMWNEAKRLRNIKDKDLAERIHRKLKHYPYAETLDELLNVIDDILSILGKR